jgi:hypothetical protein
VKWGGGEGSEDAELSPSSITITSWRLGLILSASVLEPLGGHPCVSDSLASLLFSYGDYIYSTLLLSVFEIV